MGAFNDAVYAAVCRIPAGKVATYGQIARLIGQPRKARFVGYAMHTTPQPQDGEEGIPSHRVVFKDGGLCEGYAFGGPEAQRALLEAEGVQFIDDMHVDMDTCRWNGCDMVPGTGAQAGVYAENGLEGSMGNNAQEKLLPLAPPEDFDWEAELGEI